ncbi:MAG TPA: hypothetical protein VFM48_06640, partial [Aquabacterium sp.]|nr:hypothetical protein [Aquabacterium sp.]
EEGPCDDDMGLHYEPLYTTPAAPSQEDEHPGTFNYIHEKLDSVGVPRDYNGLAYSLCGRIDWLFSKNTAPSQEPIKDHVIREAVNQLRDCAIKFHATQQLRERIAGIIVPLLKSTPAAPSQPVTLTDEVPKGFIPLQRENGKLIYAACLDGGRYHGWLMWKHPDGQWVTKRKMTPTEIMQAEDQDHYGIVQDSNITALREKESGK